jgi:hypothetical protein
MDADLFIRFADVARLHHLPRIWSRMRYYPEQKNRRLRAKSDAEGRLIRNRYRVPPSRWQRRALHRLARTARIGWKLATGRYFLSRPPKSGE